MKKNLKCPHCGSDLELNIGFTGCDWESEAGEGSNFDYDMSLDCINRDCGHCFTIGYLKNPSQFSPPTDERKTYKYR